VPTGQAGQAFNRARTKNQAKYSAPDGAFMLRQKFLRQSRTAGFKPNCPLSPGLRDLRNSEALWAL